MEPRIQFHTLVQFVGAEGITNQTFRTLHPPLELNKGTSKLESQNLSAETYDPNPEVYENN